MGESAGEGVRGAERHVRAWARGGGRAEASEGLAAVATAVATSAAVDTAPTDRRCEEGETDDFQARGQEDERGKEERSQGCIRQKSRPAISVSDTSSSDIEIVVPWPDRSLPGASRSQAPSATPSVHPRPLSSVGACNAALRRSRSGFEAGVCGTEVRFPGPSHVGRHGLPVSEKGDWQFLTEALA